MLFCQLGRAHSLREILGGLKSCAGKLSHLGIEAPARSTLSYANSNRPWQTFEKVFYGLFETVAARALGKHKYRFKNKLVSTDSTVPLNVERVSAIRLFALSIICVQESTFGNPVSARRAP